MKKYLLLILLLSVLINAKGATDSMRVALVLVDIQDFYFSGGVSELDQPKEAALKAKRVLEFFRENNWPIVHVKHQFSPGGNINELVRPVTGEKVVEKTEVNAFKGTDLLTYLNEKNINKLVVAGMQTHMCVEAAVRAASDFGFDVILVDDACATRDLEINGCIIKSKDVHLSTLVTLKSYAEVIRAEEIEKCFRF